MSDQELTLWRVHEGSESHVVIAEDSAQARGIAFGHRFADPDEWCDGTPSMRVEPISYQSAMRIVVAGEPVDGAAIVAAEDADRHLPKTLAYHLSIATGPAYLGGSLQ